MPTIATSQESSDFCSFDKEHLLGAMPMHNVDLQAFFSVTALLILVSRRCPLLFLSFRLMSPLSKDETGCGCALDSCDVVIVGILVNRRCFLLSLESL